MKQMPISECYLPKFNIQPHYHRLIVYNTRSQIGISTPEEQVAGAENATHAIVAIAISTMAPGPV